MVCQSAFTACTSAGHIVCKEHVESGACLSCCLSSAQTIGVFHSSVHRLVVYLVVCTYLVVYLNLGGVPR
eukprot:1098231-Pelagomonas_calceolata.AAC.2